MKGIIILTDTFGNRRNVFWRRHLDRNPSESLSGTTSSQRQKFVAGVMEHLRNTDQTADRDLIGDAVEAVDLNQGKWPKGEPVRTFRWLVDSINQITDEKEERWRQAIVVLQAFLLEFADRIEKGEKVFSKNADSLMRIMLSAMRKDLISIGHNQPTGMTYRIALMLASNYSAIPSRKHRAGLIRLLRSLGKVSTEYDHPFLADLVLIYDKMDLGTLEDIWENASA